ncbi:hypothetical protein CLV99_1062 [Sphingobacterium yanglingense]|uniref:Uncharacterized protein n=1 Tax=Sphingobacterium yanglingense TaxID=1437280 RepID=A0A4R6WMN8_9SPHI|nr:hypothetical protein CLV99_1062 [Sphingobacterium yanglingense]
MPIFEKRRFFSEIMRIVIYKQRIVNIGQLLCYVYNGNNTSLFGFIQLFSGNYRPFYSSYY